jgi:hypothetical protein
VNVITFGMAYFLVALLASGIFIAAGWRNHARRSVVAAAGRHGLPTDPLWGEEDIDINASRDDADVGAAMRLALKRLAPLLASQSVLAEVAITSGLSVRMRGAPLVDLLEELLTAAIQSAPASRLLLTAARHGDRVYVGITDDMPGVDSAARLGSVRGLKERVALRGGALDVNVRPAEGTTMTLRLAAVTDDGMDRLPPMPDPVRKVSSAPNEFPVRVEQ